MSTFRSALRVAWRHPVYLVSYLAIVSLIGVLVGRLVADQAAAAPSSYEPVRASVAVVDEDGSDLSRAFASWAGGRFDLVETDGTQEVQDALARSLVDCVLVLPQGFGQELLDAARAGDDLPNVQATYGMTSRPACWPRRRPASGRRLPAARLPSSRTRARASWASSPRRPWASGPTSPR